MQIKWFHHLSAASLAAFVGCSSLSKIPSVGPDYDAPKLDLPASALPDAGQATSALTKTCEYKRADSNADDRVIISNDRLAQWWNRFDDSVLSNLVVSAVSNNVGYLIAQRRLEQAEWELLGVYSDFLPKFGIDGGWTHTVKRGNNINYDATGVKSWRGEGYNLGAKGTWEIDIFGGTRRRTENALALAQAAGWTVADAWVSLTSQIGTQYINLRTTQERIQVARTNLKLQSETYDILKSRLDSGIGDELAVNQCAYIVEQTRARIPSLLATEESLKNALTILAGRLPGELNEYLMPFPVQRDWLLAPQKVDTLPVNMIRSRPDVQKAERELAAQCARIGVAKAMWYPKLYLIGTVGVEAKHFSRLFDADSIMSSFGPSITWAIFQSGAIYANVKAEETKTRAALLTYEQAIQNAMAEVRNAYAAYTQEYHRFKSLKSAVKAASDAVTISQDLYKNGLKDFNNVLDAQRSRLELEEQMVLSRGMITTDLIELYRSLGGGLAVPVDEAR